MTQTETFSEPNQKKKGNRTNVQLGHIKRFLWPTKLIGFLDSLIVPKRKKNSRNCTKLSVLMVFVKYLMIYLYAEKKNLRLNLKG